MYRALLTCPLSDAVIICQVHARHDWDDCLWPRPGFVCWRWARTRETHKQKNPAFPRVRCRDAHPFPLSHSLSLSHIIIYIYIYICIQQWTHRRSSHHAAPECIEKESVPFATAFDRCQSTAMTRMFTPFWSVGVAAARRVIEMGSYNRECSEGVCLRPFLSVRMPSLILSALHPLISSVIRLASRHHSLRSRAGNSESTSGSCSRTSGSWRAM